MRINRILIIVLLLLISTSGTFAQNYYNNQRGRDRSIVPRTNTLPSQKEYETEFKERLVEHIQDFIDSIEVDEFQKHIIKQKLESYYDEKIVILKSEELDSEEKNKRVEYLNNTHFNDLKELTPVKIQDSIQQFIMTQVKDNDKRKKEKKKRKKDN